MAAWVVLLLLAGYAGGSQADFNGSLVGTTAAPSTFSVRNLGPGQGLSHSHALSVLQDREGKDSCGWERGSDSTGSTPTNASPFSTTAATPTGRELLFGGIRGFNAFFPERIRENPYKPPVVLTDLLIFNRPVRIGDASPLQQSLPFTQKIVLTHEQSVVFFRFSALNFRSPEKNRYAYKLEGLDKDWNHVDSSRRFATYAHLPPGRYVFRVKAANNDGVWNEEGTALALEVKPAWRLTWWFRGLGAALALALFGVLYHAKLRQLEAFSYSVSHDLRAPLRAIEGFSGILHKEYRDRLDDRGVEYLDHVRSAVKRMNQMIEALLELSRISRVEVARERVDLSELARETAEMLTAQDPGREVVFRIAPDLEVEGDPVLLRVLVQNLLENAWKFTANRRQAVIEFGRTEVGGKGALFVRDNGVGFDGKYADKLFRPFPRLHSRGRLPGTGIGLATVQRIVERHGGTIWAEGTQGEGATFYFFL